VKTDQPNIVIILLDCVRASDYAESGPGQAADLPTLSALRGSSVDFPNAIAPSTWTVPSHASLFTGVDPWEHGCHSANDLALDPAFPTLASELQRDGYATVCLSANAWLREVPGLARGFETLRWNRLGSWLRLQPERPLRFDAPPMGVRSEPARVRRAEPKPPAAIAASLAFRFPWTIELVRRVLNGVAPGTDHVPYSSPWIEPELKTALADVPTSKPVFCFLNLMDAHEPILLDKDAVPSVREWFRYYSLPQTFSAFARDGPHDPRALAPLHQEYVRAIQRLDQRVARIVEVLRKSGRWERTLLVVTSDHGQAFGEDGGVFHTGPPIPSRARVPLMIRPPGGTALPVRRSEWTSLTSVKRMILDAVRNGGDFSSSLETVRSNSSLGNVAFTCSDGLLPGFPLSDLLSENTFRKLDVVIGAAYEDSSFVMARPNADQAIIQAIPGFSSAPSDGPMGAKPVSEAVLQKAKNVAGILESARRRDGQSVSRRLEGWGYG
jgi:arylsulfatase A-like enzyme